jgi:hypothetical protein
MVNALRESIEHAVYGRMAREVFSGILREIQSGVVIVQEVE